MVVARDKGTKRTWNGRSIRWPDNYSHINYLLLPGQAGNRFRCERKQRFLCAATLRCFELACRRPRLLNISPCVLVHRQLYPDGTGVSLQGPGVDDHDLQDGRGPRKRLTGVRRRNAGDSYAMDGAPECEEVKNGTYAASGCALKSNGLVSDARYKTPRPRALIYIHGSL